MESVIKSMQHPQTGVPVKSQKQLLTTISNAFTGIYFLFFIHLNLN